MEILYVLLVLLDRRWREGQLAGVLLDVLTEDPECSAWLGQALGECAERSALAINTLVYAQVSIRFERIEELEDALPEQDFLRLPLPWEAAFLAGKCLLGYRRRSGGRRSPLPDFYIGAHAAVAGLGLLTRDATRCRAYFPGLEITKFASARFRNRFGVSL